jgi:hypothetical protein
VAAICREFYPGATPPMAHTSRLPPARLMGVNGIFVLTELAALIGLRLRV